MILLFTIIAALVLVLSSCSTMAIPQGLFVCQDPYIYYATGYEFPDGEKIEQRSEMKLNNKIQRIIILFSDYELTFSPEYDAKYSIDADKFIDTVHAEYLRDGSIKCELIHPENAHLFGGKTSFVLTKVQ